MESSRVRTVEELLQVELPAGIFDGREFTNIYCAVLFADLENSVQISRIISPEDYDRLIDEYQSAMLDAVRTISSVPEIKPPSEASVAGDQLALFFYDEQAVAFNYLLDHEELAPEERRLVKLAYARSNERLAMSALRAAVYLKTQWLANPLNVERIAHHREPIGLALGCHCDKVFLRTRPDGRRRIEGYAVNLAKRVESFSRHGRYSRIMFSQPACNLIRGTVIKHTQLRQRIFFHQHQVDYEALKGVGRMELYELKFYHRILIVAPSAELLDLYDRVFSHDPTNVWAYYQLSAHLLNTGDLDKLLRLSQRAYLANPQDEKVLLDLGNYYYSQGMLGLAEEYCNYVLKLNPEFDHVHELLARIYTDSKDFHAAVRNARRALQLSPSSPINQLNMGLALTEVEQFDEAVHHLERAIGEFPGFLDIKQYPGVGEGLERVETSGKYSARLAELAASFAASRA